MAVIVVMPFSHLQSFGVFLVVSVMVTVEVMVIVDVAVVIVIVVLVVIVVVNNVVPSAAVLAANEFADVS